MDIIEQIDKGISNSKLENSPNKNDSENEIISPEKTKTADKHVLKKKESNTKQSTENFSLFELLSYYKNIHINTKNNQKKILQDSRSMHLAK